MKKILDNKLLFFIPLLIIMIISFLDMYNAKYLSSLYNNNLVKQIIWYFLGFIIFILFKRINNKTIWNPVEAVPGQKHYKQHQRKNKKIGSDNSSVFNTTIIRDYEVINQQHGQSDQSPFYNFSAKNFKSNKVNAKSRSRRKQQ